MLVPLIPLQALVAKITELKARSTGTIFRNCEKSNDGNPEKVIKVPFKKNKYFSFYNDGFISISISEQKEITHIKYVFYGSVSQIHINPEKKRKKHQNHFL